MKTIITLLTGKQREIDALTCGQVEKGQLALIAAQQDSNPIAANIGYRRAAAGMCADAMSNAAGKTISVDEVMNDLTEAELNDMVAQIRGYNGLTEGEATAAGSTLPTSTAA